MSAIEAGISTLGVKLGYALETVSGQKPSAFTQLERVNGIGGIELSTEQIDASALEDYVTRYVKGRQDTGGQWEITFNRTDEVVTQVKAMMSAYENRGTGLRMWFEVWSPSATQGYFVVAQPPSAIPLPEIGQNELETFAIQLTIEEYKELDTAIEPVAP